MKLSTKNKYAFSRWLGKHFDLEVVNDYTTNEVVVTILFNSVPRMKIRKQYTSELKPGPGQVNASLVMRELESKKEVTYADRVERIIVESGSLAKWVSDNKNK